MCLECVSLVRLLLTQKSRSAKTWHCQWGTWGQGPPSQLHYILFARLAAPLRLTRLTRLTGYKLTA